MKNFDDFTKMLEEENVSAELVARCDLYCEGKDLSEVELQVARTQVTTIELLRRYHKWINS